MVKKLQKYDFIFIIAMLLGLALHLLCIYGPDHFADESFYPTIPLRLMNGDNLVGDEWHLTQFSSLFLYLPVRLFVAIKGSTDGIILFLRYFYLVIHTSVSVYIYTFFRKYKMWAVPAVMMFYTQVPLRFMSANYHSLLALFLLLLTITLLKLKTKQSLASYLLAGCFYGFCCVCNPFECLVFVIYTIICIVYRFKSGTNSKLKGKALKKAKEKAEIMNKYFGSQAYLNFGKGVIIAAVISIVFFLVTGGKFSEVVDNIPNLLSDTGHDIFASPLEAFVDKVLLTFGYINDISFNLFWLLPVFCIALLIDKKRKEKAHKTVWVILSFIMSVFFMAGVTVGALNSSRCFAISLPFAIISTASYVLTENKNKELFYCMWLPSAIATIIQYLASDMHLSVLWVLIIGNIAGVFFVKDFVAETFAQKDATKKSKSAGRICAAVFCVGMCLQIVLQSSLYVVGRTVKSDYVKLENGPYQGLYMSQSAYNKNNAIMADLDVIKELTDSDAPVLIISEFSWMYLYIDRPFATYSAWQPYLESSRIIKYYKENPGRIPYYIYVGYTTIPRSVLSGHGHDVERAMIYVDSLQYIFNCQATELSNGILLKVEERELSV